MLKLGRITEFVIHFYSTRAGEGAHALIHEGGESAEKGVNKLILIGESRFLVEYV